MRQFSKLHAFCTVIALALAFFLIAAVHSAKADPYQSTSIFDLRGVNSPERPAVLKFLADVQAKLPPSIVYAMSHNIIPGREQNATSRPLIVDFGWLSGMLLPPVCEPVNRMEIAQQRKKEWRDAADRNSDTLAFRYDGETQVQVVKDSNSTAYGEKLILNRNLLPAIESGPKLTPDFPCGHHTYYQLAEAAVIHGIARIYDNISVKAAERMNEQDDQRVLEPMNWISESVRYRNLTFGWKGEPGRYDQSNLAYWPRAVSAYEFASDVRANFAFNLEYYLLDPEYRCRRPLLYQYFSKIFGTRQAPFTPQYDQPSACDVNTKIFLQFTNRLTNNTYYVGNGETDLSPNLVREVDYYRASVGNDAASLFGHAMYRLVVCTPGATDEECQNDKYMDLIINPRANPMEMHLDQFRGVFGGYPSQFFISRYQDIFGEYAQTELRHLFSFPLGHTIGGRFTTLSKPEVTDFIWATLEYYWEYIGTYKFVTNNCADETLRLYKTAFNNSDINEANVITPKGVSDLFDKKGVIEDKLYKEVREPGFMSHFPTIGHLFWTDKDQEQQRKAIEKDSEHIDESLLFSIQDKIADIYKREHGGKKLASLSDINSEMKKWAELATVNDKASEFCKNNERYATTQAQIAELGRRIDELESRYMNLYEPLRQKWQAGDSSVHDDMKEINDDFLAIVTYMLDKRMSDLNDISVEIAYEIANPNDGKKTLCGRNGFPVTAQMRKQIQDILAEYTKVQYEMLPFDSKMGAAPGYGIPLYSETYRSQQAGQDRLKAVMADNDNIMTTLLNTTGRMLGMDWQLFNQLKGARFKLMSDNCRDRLDVIAGMPFYCRQLKDSPGQIKADAADRLNAVESNAVAQPGISTGHE